MSNRTIAQGVLITIVCASSMIANTRYDAPPRYDGAGYAVLARSIGEGRGYREIDHPDAPRHAHFPPGYPMTLAGVWRVAGESWRVSHAFSTLCTIAACLVFWRWVSRWASSSSAFVMAIALAVNWRWGRDGAAIQSEPLFAMLGLVAVWWSDKVSRRGSLLLGVLLGAIVLTRHAGAPLVVAVLASLWMRTKTREAISAAVPCLLVILPWAAWLGIVGANTQVGLVPVRGVGHVVASNAIFYAQRLIDSLIGPVIEVATVFRPQYAAVATVAAIVAAVPILVGWVRMARSPERRLAGLVPLLSMPMLLIWPFTEAGRFLVPMIPFLLVGFVEGVGRISRTSHLRAAIIALAISLPYPVYAVATGRAEFARASHRAFDRACARIAEEREPRGPVLSRHPGEVFLLTGRTSVASPDAASPEDVQRMIDRHGVVFLLVDDARFARAPASPIGKYVDAFPDRVAHVDGREVAVYRIVPRAE